MVVVGQRRPNGDRSRWESDDQFHCLPTILVVPFVPSEKTSPSHPCPTNIYKHFRRNTIRTRYMLRQLCLSVRLTVTPVNRTCQNGLTLSSPIPLRLYALPYLSSPPFLIVDIRALWRSVLSAKAPECHKLKMVHGWTSLALNHLNSNSLEQLALKGLTLSTDT